jgi:MFS family permease
VNLSAISAILLCRDIRLRACLGGRVISEAIRTAPLPAVPPLVGVATEPVDHENRIIAVTSVGHTLCHVGEGIFAGILLTLMAEFDLSKDHVTLLGLCGFVLFGVGAVPTGIASDRWGARRVLILYFFWLAAAATLVALATSPWTLAAALTFLGAALSLYHPAALAMLTHGCRHRGHAMGINGVAGNVGVAGGPALGILCASYGHWRLAYVLVAGLSLLSGLAMLMFPIDETPVTPATQDDAPPPVQRVAPGLWLLFAAMLLGGLNYRSLMTALPTYLSETGSLVPASMLTFAVLMVGGIGQYAGGHFADRTRVTLLYVGLITFTLLPALVLAHSAAVAVPAAMFLAIGMFAQQPIENIILAQTTPARRRSTFFGLKFILTFGVGAVGTQLVGIIWQETGSLGPVFDVFALNALLMASLAWLFVRSRGRLRSAAS